MRRALVLVAALGFSGAAALASNLNVSVKSGGQNGIQVTPGQVVSYSVIGELTDAVNEGLALIGFDLSYSCGDLSHADIPIVDPMANFVRPDGITNPDLNCPPECGYGGTLQAGMLLQCGGGQNTINNDVGNAPFPTGMVITGIAQPGSPQVLVTGTLTIPPDALNGAVCTLTLSNMFVNVIEDGETGLPPQNFYKTEAAGEGANTPLTMTVSTDCVATIIATDPPNCAVDARQPHDLNNVNTCDMGATPHRCGWQSITLSFPCAPAAGLPDAPGDFTVSVVAGGAPVINNVTVDGNDVTLDFDQPIPTLAWTCVSLVSNPAEQVCLGYLPGDVNVDGTTAPADILGEIDCINGVATFDCNIWNTDIDRSGVTGPPDILRVIDLLNGAAEFDVWFNAMLGEACPSE